MGEGPTTPGTGHSARGPGAQCRHPPLHLPALRPRGCRGDGPQAGPAPTNSGRKPREDGPPWARLCPQTVLMAGSRPGYLQDREVNKREPGLETELTGEDQERASASGKALGAWGLGRSAWAGRAGLLLPGQRSASPLASPRARGIPRAQGWVAGLADGCPELCLEGRGGLVVRDGRPDGHTQSCSRPPAPGGSRTKTGHVAPSSPASLELRFPPGHGQRPGRASRASPALRTKPRAVTCSQEWSGRGRSPPASVSLAHSRSSDGCVANSLLPSPGPNQAPASPQDPEDSSDQKKTRQGTSPGGTVVENPPGKAGDAGLSPQATPRESTRGDERACVTWQGPRVPQRRPDAPQ